MRPPARHVRRRGGPRVRTVAYGRPKAVLVNGQWVVQQAAVDSFGTRWVTQSGAQATQTQALRLGGFWGLFAPTADERTEVPR